MGALMQAAREARKASDGARVVTISLVEEGFIVLAAKEGRYAAIDIAWHDIDLNAGALTNAVLLVKGRV